MADTHPNEGQNAHEQTIDQEPAPEAADIEDEAKGPDFSAEDGDRSIRRRKSTLGNCGISTIILVVYFTLLYAVIVGTPHAKQLWNIIPHYPAQLSQQHAWHGSSAWTAVFNKVNLASASCESFSYDPHKDRFLRYVNETESGRSSHLNTATYVRQHAE